MTDQGDEVAWLSDPKNLLDDAIRQLNALNAPPLTDGRVHETDRPRAIEFLHDQIEEIRVKKPKGLWEHADTFRKLEADFESLIEQEKSRPRWSPPR